MTQLDGRATAGSQYPRFVVRQSNTAASCRPYCESALGQLQQQLQRNIASRQSVKVDLDRCMGMQRTKTRDLIRIQEDFKRLNRSLTYAMFEQKYHRVSEWYIRLDLFHDCWLFSAKRIERVRI